VEGNGTFIYGQCLPGAYHENYQAGFARKCHAVLLVDGFTAQNITKRKGRPAFVSNNSGGKGMGF